MTIKILVALDRSEMRNNVFETALSLATMSQSNLMLLHTLAEEEDIVDSLYQAEREEWQRYERQSYQELQNLAEKARRANVKAECVQNFGSPGQNICNMAKTWLADLIVIGRRGHSGLKEVILGSVSTYVTHHASCSVLIVQGYDSPFKLVKSA
ncbi:MAG: universal stress protein [Cyanobacteria bacterium P01_G01_bin.19]